MDKAEEAIVMVVKEEAEGVANPITDKVEVVIILTNNSNTLELVVKICNRSSFPKVNFWRNLDKKSRMAKKLKSKISRTTSSSVRWTNMAHASSSRSTM
jgi:hypothetical protein